MKGKILKKSRLAARIKPFGVEHLTLESIDVAKRSGNDGVSSRKIINIINDPSNPLTEFTKSSSAVTNGAIYGTLSRLKGKGLVKKVLVSNGSNEELAYKITAKGSRELTLILTSAKNVIEGMTSYMPDLVGA